MANDLVLTGLQALPYQDIPAQLVLEVKDPTSANYNTLPYRNFQIGTFWLNTVNQNLWYLAAIQTSPKVQGKWVQLSAGAPSIETLSGNTGTNPVSPLLNNINVFGDGVGINISGDGANKLTASLVGGGIAAQSFVTDVPGPVTPTAAGVLNVKGVTGSNIQTTGVVANTVGINLTGITQHTVQIGGASNVLTQLANGTTGQVLTAQTGADPIWQSDTFITSPVTGTAIPSAGVLTFSGSGGMVATAGTSTVSYAPPALACAFYVELNEELNVSGDGTNFSLGAVTAGTVHFDLGSNINAGGGGTPITFTAPATGYYQFNCNFQVAAPAGVGIAMNSSLINSAGTNLSANALNNLPTQNGCTGFVGTNTFIGMNGGLFTKLNMGDTIRVHFSCGPTGTKTASIENTGSFSGFRVA